MRCLSLERIRFDIGINQLGSTSGARLSWLEEKKLAGRRGSRDRTSRRPARQASSRPGPVFLLSLWIARAGCDETRKVCGEQTWETVIATEMQDDQGRAAAGQCVRVSLSLCVCVSASVRLVMAAGRRARASALKCKLHKGFLNFGPGPTSLDETSPKQMWKVGLDAPPGRSRDTREVCSQRHILLFVPPLQASRLEPPSLSAGAGASHRDGALLGMGAGPTAACRAGLLCKALLAQEVNGPSFRCYSTTGTHASQIPRVQGGRGGGGLLPWTVPPAHAVQLDVRSANRGPGEGSGCCSTSSSQPAWASPGGGLGPATTFAPIWTQGLGTISL